MLRNPALELCALKLKIVRFSYFFYRKGVFCWGGLLIYPKSEANLTRAQEAEGARARIMLLPLVAGSAFCLKFVYALPTKFGPGGFQC